MNQCEFVRKNALPFLEYQTNLVPATHQLVSVLLFGEGNRYAQFVGSRSEALAEARRYTAAERVEPWREECFWTEKWHRGNCAFAMSLADIVVPAGAHAEAYLRQGAAAHLEALETDLGPHRCDTSSFLGAPVLPHGCRTDDDGRPTRTITVDGLDVTHSSARVTRGRRSGSTSRSTPRSGIAPS